MSGLIAIIKRQDFLMSVDARYIRDCFGFLLQLHKSVYMGKCYTIFHIPTSDTGRTEAETCPVKEMYRNLLFFFFSFLGIFNLKRSKSQLLYCQWLPRDG